MTGRRPAQTAPGRLRRHGVRVSSGPWTICGDRASEDRGRLIMVLGRTAGNAATRSRIRRIMREVFAQRFGSGEGVDLLLLARSNVEALPRRQVRAGLGELAARLSRALARRQADQQGDA